VLTYGAVLVLRRLHMLSKEELDKRYTYHAPKPGQPARYEAIRDKARELAELIDGMCPDSRELSVSLTSIEDAVMWANAAIARNE